MKPPHPFHFALIPWVLLWVASMPVYADSINFAPDPPPGKITAKFDFNNPAEIPDALYINPRLGRLSTVETETINGTPAVVGKVEPTKSEDLNIFLELRAGNMEPNKVYRVSFDYKVLEASPADGQVFCGFRPDKRKYATAYLGDEVGVKKRMHYTVTPGDEPNCGLWVGIIKGGAVAVDNILIEELPVIDTSTITYNQKKGSWKEFAGMATHLNWRHFYKSDEEVIKMLDLLQKLNVGMIRVTFGWDDIFRMTFDQVNDEAMQRLNLIVDESKKRNIKVLGLIGMTPLWASSNPDAGHSSRCYPAKSREDYKRYVRYVAETFKGRVSHWEVYNEPDLPHFWKAPISEYMEDLKAAYVTLKGVDPDNFVINGGLSTAIFRGRKDSNLDALYDLVDPKMTPYYDALCVHPYEWNTSSALYSINNLLDLMKEKNVSKPIWITETGYSVFGSRTEEDQADFLERLLTNLAAHPEVQKVFIYNDRQKADSKSPYEAGLGIITHDFKPRASYIRLQKLFSGPFPDKNPSFKNPSVGMGDEGINGGGQ